jgi:hypothetical protein
MGKEVPDWLNDLAEAEGNRERKAENERLARDNERLLASQRSREVNEETKKFLMVQWTRLNVDPILEDIRIFLGGDRLTDLTESPNGRFGLLIKGKHIEKSVTRYVEGSSSELWSTSTPPGYYPIFTLGFSEVGVYIGHVPFDFKYFTRPESIKDNNELKILIKDALKQEADRIHN